MDQLKTLKDLKASELKEFLEKKGLDSSGKKPDLYERLKKELIKEGQDPELYCFNLEEKSNEEEPNKIQENMSEIGNTLAGGDEELVHEKEVGDKEMMLMRFMESQFMRLEQKQSEEQKRISKEQKEDGKKLMEKLEQLSTQMDQKLGEQNKDIRTLSGKLEEHIEETIKKYENLETEVLIHKEKIGNLQENIQVEVIKGINKNINMVKEEIIKENGKEMEYIRRCLIKRGEEMTCLEEEVRKGIIEIRNETERDVGMNRKMIEKEIKKIKELYETYNEKMQNEGLKNRKENQDDLQKKIEQISKEMENWKMRNERNREMEEPEITSQMEGNMKKRLEDIYKEIKKDLENMRRKINGSEITNNTYIQSFSEENLRFDGNIRKIHPKVFLKILENKIKHLDNFDDIKEVIRKHLIGQALLWYTAVKNLILIILMILRTAL